MNRILSLLLCAVVLALTGCSSSTDSFSSNSIQKRKYRKGFHFPNRAKHQVASDFSMQDSSETQQESIRSKHHSIIERNSLRAHKPLANDVNTDTTKMRRVQGVIANRTLSFLPKKRTSIPNQRFKGTSNPNDDEDNQYAFISLIFLGISVALMGAFPPLVFLAAGLGIFYALKSRREIGVTDASTIGLIGNIVMLILGLLIILLIVGYILFFIGLLFI